MLPEFGNDSYEAADNFMTGRANGLLTYHNRSPGGTVDGTDLGLQYQGRIGGRRSTGEGYPDAKRRWLRLFRHLRHRRGAQRWRRLRQLCAHAGATALRRLTAIAPGHGPRAEIRPDNLYGGKLRAYREHDLRRRRSLRRLRPRADAIEAVAQYHSIPASRPRWPTCKRAAATCPASATPIWSNTRIWR